MFTWKWNIFQDLNLGPDHLRDVPQGPKGCFTEWVPKTLKPSIPFHGHLEVEYIFRISIQVSGSQFRFQDLNPGPNQLRDVPQGPKTLFWGYFWWFLQS
jgi:hypothetical protein